MNPKLTARRVDRVFMYCLYRGGEVSDPLIKVEGITTTVGFHPKLLAEHKDEIEALLDELPDEFKKTGGGGMSFLNACMDKHGNQWTGFHMSRPHFVRH